MNRQFDVTYQGREYTVTEGASPAEAAAAGGAVAGPGRWYITLGPKAVGSIDAPGNEAETALRERVLRWLAEHPELPRSERIVLGGG